MPWGPEMLLISKPFFRDIVMSTYISKFSGFLAKNRLTSQLLAKLKLSVIPKNLLETFTNGNYKTLNEAFSHRYERQSFPLKTDKVPKKIARKIMISPVDAYLNIRKIKNLKVELYPEVVLDLKKMIGEKNSAKFLDGGTMFLFTLKPQHDHTVDYPFNSEVIDNPVVFSRKNKKIYSTDLNFAKYSKKSFFAENHRVVTKLKAIDFENIYFLVEVGATNVNSITQDNCEVGKIYSKGTQKSHFNFGSTVILLLPQNFSNKIKILDIFSQDFKTSTEVERKNILAIPKMKTNTAEFYIADMVKVFLENGREKIIRQK